MLHCFGGAGSMGCARFCSRVLLLSSSARHPTLLQRPDTESCPSLNCASWVLSMSPQPAAAWPRSRCSPARVTVAQGQGVQPPCCLPPMGCSGQGCWALPGLSHSSSDSAAACALGFPATN